MATLMRYVFPCDVCHGEMTIDSLWLTGTAKIGFHLICESCGNEKTELKSHRNLNKEVVWEGA